MRGSPGDSASSAVAGPASVVEPPPRQPPFGRGGALCAAPKSRSEVAVAFVSRLLWSVTEATGRGVTRRQPRARCVAHTERGFARLAPGLPVLHHVAEAPGCRACWPEAPPVAVQLTRSRVAVGVTSTSSIISRLPKQTVKSGRGRSERRDTTLQRACIVEPESVPYRSSSSAPRRAPRGPVQRVASQLGCSHEGRSRMTRFLAVTCRRKSAHGQSSCCRFRAG